MLSDSTTCKIMKRDEVKSFIKYLWFTRWAFVSYFNFLSMGSFNIFLLYSRLDKIIFHSLTFLPVIDFSRIAWNDLSRMSWNASAWTCALASREIPPLTTTRQFPSTASSSVASFFFSISAVGSRFHMLLSSLIFRNRRIQNLGFWNLGLKGYRICFQ